jgi:glycosyltransferase involved in cell wall biosynthesis
MSSEALFPKISIITPSYNQGAFLEECILSVVEQNYPNLEYIIMDGGSNDLSSLIIERHRHHFSHVRIGRDKGQYHAIQEGIEKSTGDIIAWLNSDDKFHPGAFWRMAQAVKIFPKNKWFTGLPSVWNQFGALNYINTSPPEFEIDYLKQLPDDPAPYYIQQESTFFKRTIWEEAGGSLDLGLDLAADYELWLRFTRIEQVKQLKCLIGGFRIQPLQRSSLKRDQYIAEVRSVIADCPAMKSFPDATSPDSPSPQSRGSYLEVIEKNFVLATSISPHRQYNQFKAVETWLKAGFKVLSFNERNEISQLEASFPSVDFVEVDRTARPLVGKPLIFIRDILANLKDRGYHNCGIINSDISFINSTGILDACSYHLTTHDAIFASRIEVQQPERQIFNNIYGGPSLKFGPIYIWGFDLFLFSDSSVKKLLESLLENSNFALGVPWWDYLIPSKAIQLGMKIGLLHPPPISHLTHAANYDWRSWQYYGHQYLHAIGKLDAPTEMYNFVPQFSDEWLMTISQQFVQMLIRGSTIIELGSIIHQENEWPNNLLYDTSSDTIRQLGVINAYKAEPFLNFPGYLRDQFQIDNERRDGLNLLLKHGIEF